MNWKAAGLLLTVITLVACTLVDQGRSQIESEVKQVARDPDSVKFAEEMHINNAGETRLSCGSVNSKNGYGGYTGMVAFMGWQGTYHFASDEPRASERLDACCHFVSASIDAKAPPWGRSGYKDACEGLATPFNFSKL